MRRVTTHDIAREAGVSRTTVSHVLNNQPGINLSQKTKARVLATARRLGYVPNSAAQMLVTGRSRCIGLVFPRADLLAVDAFVPIMIHGLNEVCRARGYHLVMEAITEPPGDDAYSDLAKSKRVDCLIVVNPRKGDVALRKVIKSKFPVLVAGTAEQSGENAIATQEAQASCQVTGHLISLGHQRIAHIGHASLDYVAVCRRLEGYRVALESASLPFYPGLVNQGDFTLESGYSAMKRILASNIHPTALFAGNDTIAIGAMLAIREAGLSIPRDFAVAGYDDAPGAAYACPPLTTVRTHAYEHGKLFAEAAIRLMDNKEVGSQRAALPLELIIRESCGARASRTLSHSIESCIDAP
ncbi:MAG TPA: LacI family DNA-binding transcriptional regulator [Terrimicrobiaceae bacterium]